MLTSFPDVQVVVGKIGSRQPFLPGRSFDFQVSHNPVCNLEIVEVAA